MIKKPTTTKTVFVAAVWFVLIWFAYAMHRDEEAQASAQAHEEFQHYPYTSVPAASSENDLKRGCTVLYLQTSDKRNGDLTLNELDLIATCRRFHLYKDNQ
jgi:hypothetical protein